MIKAVQNNNACELPKATNNNVSDQSSSSSDDDVTLKRRANSTATNSAATTAATATASAVAAANDDEDDCVYISPDEAENGMNLGPLFSTKKLIYRVWFPHRANTHRFGHGRCSNVQDRSHEKARNKSSGSSQSGACSS